MAMLRTAIPLMADVFRRRGDDPDFGRAEWVSGIPAGTLLNSRRIRAAGLGNRLNDAHGWRIDYVTTDGQGRTVSATGAAFRSLRPWNGPGPRPTIAFAPSTQGVAPHCDPSYSGTVGIRLRWPLDLVAAYEQPVINYFVALGCHVVLTDYPRDPEDNVQLYCDHPAAAHSLIDALRAARTLGINYENLGLWGFSQGGGAVGAFLEHPDYAPEIRPRAAVIGAPPADLAATLLHVDGSLASVVVAYAIAGLVAQGGDVAEEIGATLNPRGTRLLRTAAGYCAPGAAVHAAWHSTKLWTHSGRPVGVLLDDLPATAAELAQRNLGTRSPDIPVRLWGSVNDDVVPFGVVKKLALDWDVPVQTRKMPRIPGRLALNHFVPYFAHFASDARWLVSHLNR